MLADNFIERNALILRNLNTKASQDKDVWVSGTGYGFYSVPYEQQLSLDHYYYLRCGFKFTSTSTTLPTWFQYYIQGGFNVGPSVINIAQNIEYTVSGIKQPIIKNTAYPISSGILFCGDSNKVSGCTFYTKNVVAYDVTELYMVLRAKNNISTVAELKAWCDANLDYVKRYTNYDITDLVSETGSNKVCINKGNLLANNLIETDGMQYYSATSRLRDNTWFDSGIGPTVYNNSENGTVTFTRVDAKEQNSPFYPEHKYILKITTNGTASPGTGGFVARHMAAANKIFIEKFVAKVPVGYTVTAAYNSQGTGARVTFLTSRAGTGDWAEYAILYKCGSSGSFSDGGYVYLTGPSNTSVTWYLAYANNCDITSDENLKYYSVLKSKEVFKAGSLYTSHLDETNLLANGDCSDTTTSMLPTGWTYDTTDVAGNAKASIVQPVGAGTGNYGIGLPINPNNKYKISFWVKCKGDMTSFLTAVVYKTTASGGELGHRSVVWVPGTKTTLSAALSPGDTSMTVANAANWKVWNYSRIGFRSGSISSCSTYNDKGTSNMPSGSAGMIASVSGNTVNFNTAYTGAAQPAGTVVVESYDGGSYPYPIHKSMLPTNNEWKYVEGYFGTDNKVWEGDSSGGWIGIPGDARYMNIILNLCTNDGSVPIKFADIRVEAVGVHDTHRYEQKIQIKKETN